MEIIDNAPDKPAIVTATQIPHGTVFRWTNKQGVKRICLRTYDGIVDLRDLSQTWNATPYLIIRGYIPVRAHLVIEGVEE